MFLDFYFLLVVLILFLFGLHFLQRGLMFHYIQTFIMFKHVEFGKHTWIHTSEIKKVCSFQNFIPGWSVYASFFLFFIPGWNFIPAFHPMKWNFISAKTCKQYTWDISPWTGMISSRDEFHPGMKFHV